MDVELATVSLGEGRECGLPTGEPGSDLFGARVTVRSGTSRIEPGATPLLPQVLVWATSPGMLGTQ